MHPLDFFRDGIDDCRDENDRLLDVRFGLFSFLYLHFHNISTLFALSVRPSAIRLHSAKIAENI